MRKIALVPYRYRLVPLFETATEGCQLAFVGAFGLLMAAVVYVSVNPTGV